MTMKSNVADMSDGGKPSHSRSFWRDAIAFILRDRLTLFAISILLVATVICSFSPLVI